MIFYYNENYLINNAANLVDNIKELKRYYDIIHNNGNKLMVTNHFETCYQFSEFNKLGVAIGFIQHLEKCNEVNIFLESNDIHPEIEDYYFIELMSICYLNRNNLIVSSMKEELINHNEYCIKDRELSINNIIGDIKLKDYIIRNPIPSSITEVLERCEMNFKNIKFTEIAYKTVASKNDVYKDFGFDKILNIFRIIQELLYPFYRGDLINYTQETIQNEFKHLTGVEFSSESRVTLNKYNRERTIIYNGRKIIMSFHIKIRNQARIYFSYENQEDCILIGHSGGHLKCIKYK